LCSLFVFRGVLARFSLIEEDEELERSTIYNKYKGDVEPDDDCIELTLRTAVSHISLILALKMKEKLTS